MQLDVVDAHRRSNGPLRFKSLSLPFRLPLLLVDPTFRLTDTLLGLLFELLELLLKDSLLLLVGLFALTELKLLIGDVVHLSILISRQQHHGPLLLGDRMAHIFLS